MAAALGSSTAAPGIGLRPLAPGSPRTAGASAPWRAARRSVGAILAGGIIAPGAADGRASSNMPASGASLLLNAEGGVHRGARMGRLPRERRPAHRARDGRRSSPARCVLSVPAGARDRNAHGPRWPCSAACFCWGLDNNLTRKVALNDATWLAAVKGLVAGPVNLILAFALGARSRRPAASRRRWSSGSSPTASAWHASSSGATPRHPREPARHFSVAPFFGAVLDGSMLGDTAHLAARWWRRLLMAARRLGCI